MSVWHCATGVVGSWWKLLQLQWRHPFLRSALTLFQAQSPCLLQLRFSSLCSCGAGTFQSLCLGIWHSSRMQFTLAKTENRVAYLLKQLKKKKRQNKTVKQYKSPRFLLGLSKMRVIRFHRVVCQEGNFFPCAAYNQPGAIWGREVHLPLKHKVLAPARGCVPEIWSDMANFMFLCTVWSFHFYATHCNKLNNESSHEWKRKESFYLPVDWR